MNELLTYPLATAIIGSFVTFAVMARHQAALSARLRESATETMEAERYADECRTFRIAAVRESCRLRSMNDELVRITEEAVGRIPDRKIAESLWCSAERAIAREVGE